MSSGRAVEFWQDAYERAMRIQKWRNEWRGAWEWYQLGYRLDVIAGAMRTDVRSVAVALRVYQDWLEEYPPDSEVWKSHRRELLRFLKLYGGPEDAERSSSRRRHPSLQLG